MTALCTIPSCSCRGTWPADAHTLLGKPCCELWRMQDIYAQEIGMKRWRDHDRRARSALNYDGRVRG